MMVKTPAIQVDQKYVQLFNQLAQMGANIYCSGEVVGA
jgi:hypothetical protein